MGPVLQSEDWRFTMSAMAAITPESFGDIRERVAWLEGWQNSERERYGRLGDALDDLRRRTETLELRVDRLVDEVAELRAELGTLRAEMEAGMVKLRSEFKADIAELRQAITRLEGRSDLLEQRMAHLQDSVEGRFRKLDRINYLILAAVLAGLVRQWLLG